MAVAYLPSPVTGVWHLGMIPVRGYALCVLVAVVAGLWLTDRRYRQAGGQPGVILDLATVAVPVGLIGTRLYSVLTDFDRYFGPGRDWTDVLRVWDGGMGVAAAVPAGVLAAWVYCRRIGVEAGPVALAAAPGLAVAQAISVWGNWFSEELYGSPTGVPWAVAIAPQHRAAGFQSVATFQPLFLYESLLDVLVAVGVIVAIRRYSLTGSRAFALYAALWTAAGAAMQGLRIDYSPRLLGLRTNMLAMLIVLAAACAYLAAERRRRRQRRVGQPAEPAPQVQH
ncbi:MAG: prolipoprotein diacylglyceryl transferase [Actinobacteria bacterium]|nr:prolipoprotein diacylglyceryl transferase [Actinomycetota bacterium]